MKVLELPSARVILIGCFNSHQWKFIDERENRKYLHLGLKEFQFTSMEIH